MEREELQRYLAEGLSLEQIGSRVGRSPSTVSYHLKKYGLKPVNQGKHANRGAVSEDALREMAARGCSLREIARSLDRSPATIRYWVRKLGIRTRGMALRRPELERARRAGLKRVESTCRRHGRATFVLEGRGYYRCSRCRSEKVSEWRRRAKRKLIAASGGRCVLCGYDECPAALQFHHLEPADKSFNISCGGVTRSYAELEAEAAKCVLLCGNCHAEVEGGYHSLRN
jgi:DNA-binding CsgD family transcriptional regulator